MKWVFEIEQCQPDAAQARGLTRQSRRVAMKSTRQWGKSTVPAVHQAYTVAESLSARSWRRSEGRWESGIFDREVVAREANAGAWWWMGVGPAVVDLLWLEDLQSKLWPVIITGGTQRDTRTDTTGYRSGI